LAHGRNIAEKAASLGAEIVAPNAFRHLTRALITHRFTPMSKTVFNEWYNASTLEMDEDTRAKKRTKIGLLEIRLSG
jgi:hypothetical protein